MRNQLVSEIKIQYYLNHPNIIKLYDFFADNEHIYLFMELAIQGNLYNMADRCNFNEENISIIIREITKAL